MKIIFALIVLVTCICSLCAGELRQSGVCIIKEPKNMLDKKNIFSVKLNNKNLQIICKFHSGEFIDQYALFAVPWITNLSSKRIPVSYNVAFFDKSGTLLATAAQNADVPPDASGYQLGSSMAIIPKTIVGDIASYQIVIYTDGAK